MSEPSDAPDDFDQALTRSQLQEREERNADLERQARADQRIVEALARDSSVTDG